MSCLGHAGELNESKLLEWKIPNFFSLSAEKESFYASSSFELESSSWRLRIFPAGKKTSKSGFISLYLENQSFNRYRVTCNFFIKKTDGTLIPSGGSTIDIPTLGSAGFPNFYEKSVLHQRESELMPSGTLTIICILKFHEDGKQDITKDENSYGEKAVEVLGKLTDLDVLSENFRGLLTKEDSYDVVLQVKDKEFKAHKTILIARSLVFAAMFQHDTLEKQTGFIDIPDCDSESFPEFLEYLYCGKIEDISYRTAYNLYITSHKYDVQKLKEFCVEFLITSLIPDNLCDVVILADKYDDTKLLSETQDFFTENFSKIFVTFEWESLLKNNYRLANKLLIEMSKIKGSL